MPPVPVSRLKRWPPSSSAVRLRPANLMQAKRNYPANGDCWSSGCHSRRGIAQARGALTQLSQTLGQSIVRGEEFNSILEGAFPIALAAARGLDAAGGSVGRLRTLVIEGRVSSEEFFRAIWRGGGEIDQQFALTTPTHRAGIHGNSKLG